MSRIDDLEQKHANLLERLANIRAQQETTQRAIRDGEEELGVLTLRHGEALASSKAGIAEQREIDRCKKEIEDSGHTLIALTSQKRSLGNELAAVEEGLAIAHREIETTQGDAFFLAICRPLIEAEAALQKLVIWGRGHHDVYWKKPEGNYELLFQMLATPSNFIPELKKYLADH